MLKKGSSKEVPITQATISKTLKLLNFDCERKTVAKYIDALIEFGYPIIKISGGGCYLRQQTDNL